jgi:hypothetical protein
MNAAFGDVRLDVRLLPESATWAERLQVQFGDIGHFDEISRRTRRRARHIISCASSLGRLKCLICGLRDLLHVRLHRVAERSHGDEWLAAEERAA